MGRFLRRRRVAEEPSSDGVWQVPARFNFTRDVVEAYAADPAPPGPDVRRPRTASSIGARSRRSRPRPTGGRNCCAHAVSRPANGCSCVTGKTPVVACRRARSDQGRPGHGPVLRDAARPRPRLPRGALRRPRRRRRPRARPGADADGSSDRGRRRRGRHGRAGRLRPASARRTTRRRATSRSSSTPRERRRTRKGRRTPTAIPGRSACRPSTGSMSSRATSSGAPRAPAGRSRSGTSSSARGHAARRP